MIFLEDIFILKVVIIGKLLQGMDNNSELVEIGNTIDNLPYLVEDGQPMKTIILRHFIQKKWKLLGSNFYKLDDNNDGYLDKNEIKTHLNQITNNSITEIELNMMIDIMDKDKNDKISIDEFRNIL